MGQPTLELVAARAGVSRASVSRVVNGASSVSPDIRESVQRAVDELRYVPNLAARSLATRRTDAIALVLSEPPTRVFSDEPFFAGVVRGVSEELESLQRHLILVVANATTDRDRVERHIAASHVDGVLAVSTHGADPLPQTLARKGIPVACSGRVATRRGLSYVDVDNVGGAFAAVGHLLQRGRRRIATITGPQDSVAGVDRLTGYRETLRSRRRRSIVAVGDFTRESGATAMRQLLDDDPKLDGVFVANDMMAIGALRTLQATGRRVPEDVSVVGFDDIYAARLTEPALTTVHQPTEDIGRELVRMLLRLIGGVQGNRPVILPTELVVREST
ncbi:MAG: LacI family transcriptional regulator [Actinobacteria bacterium 13_2_20CM_2_71_6]|nr:MAG: LacI family transcriptional regulator [Actinobacteria bacterium 13_2_20CM_2_71_6]